MNQFILYAKQHKKRVIISAIALLLVVWGINKFMLGKKPLINSAVPVTVAKAQQATTTVDLKAVGKVYPYTTVSVRSQVDGPIVKIDFDRGQDVEVDEILFQIDPRPFEVALKQAEANLQREQAILTDAKADAERSKLLLAKSYVSQESHDQVYSNMLAQEAAVKAAEAAVENAQLQVEYSMIRSPIEGRTGDILVNLGNQVKANDTQPLVVINQLSPIFVSFDVPEKFLPDINKRLGSGEIPVRVKDVNENILSENGKLFFVDNTIDTLTGTIELKADFPNEEYELWPGQFVNVEMGLYTKENAILIPTRAIQQGQKGSYVYIVNAENKALYRPVTVGEVVGDNTIITKGVQANEQVVVNGQFRLVDGAVVELTK